MAIMVGSVAQAGVAWRGTGAVVESLHLIISIQHTHTHTHRAREKERKTERETDRQTETERKRERQRQRETTRAWHRVFDVVPSELIFTHALTLFFPICCCL
jgi:hypothetical protein